MGFFTSFFKKKEDKHEDLHNHIWEIKNNFISHTKNILDWLKYFEQKHSSHDEKISKLHEKHKEHKDILKDHHERLNSLEYYYAKTLKDPKEVRDIIEHYYSLEKNLRKLEERLSNIEKNKPKFKEETKTKIQERVFKDVSRNSKEYIKRSILSSIKKNEEISALKLKEIVVDEQRLCSRSTFYRMLSEIEKEGLASTSYSNKEKILSIEKISQ